MCNRSACASSRADASLAVTARMIVAACHEDWSRWAGGAGWHSLVREHARCSEITLETRSLRWGRGGSCIEVAKVVV